MDSGFFDGTSLRAAIRDEKNGAGSDTAYGSSDDDDFFVDDSDDVMAEASVGGNRVIVAISGFTLAESVEALRNQQADTLVGRSGSDTAYGGLADDLLYGGGEDD